MRPTDLEIQMSILDFAERERLKEIARRKLDLLNRLNTRLDNMISKIDFLLNRVAS